MANIGIATGPASGILVLDIDGERGRDSLRDLLSQHRLKKTLIAITGRVDDGGKQSGWHLYFKYPTGSSIGNSLGPLGDGIDVRGRGGYVVAPPSIHASGQKYRWRYEERGLANLPESLLALSRSVENDWEELVGDDLIRKGFQNTTLYRIGKGCRRKGMSRSDLLEHLLSENRKRCSPALPEDEVREIAESAWNHSKFGPNPLESAWKKVLLEQHRSSWSKFISLARHVQAAQPDLPILLPVVLVGKLMGLDRTRISRFRSRAIREGVLEIVADYVARKQATSFRVLLQA